MRVEHRLLETQAAAERLGGGLAGDVVGGRTQPAGHQDEVVLGEERVQLVGDVLDRVAHHSLAPQLDAVAFEQRGEAEGVGVEPVGAEKLRADGEDGRLHGPGS